MHHSSTSSHCLLPENMCFCSALLWGMKSWFYRSDLFKGKGVISKQGHVYLVEEAGFNSPSSTSRRWSPSSIEIPRNLWKPEFWSLVTTSRCLVFGQCGPCAITEVASQLLKCNQQSGLTIFLRHLVPGSPYTFTHLVLLAHLTWLTLIFEVLLAHLTLGLAGLPLGSLAAGRVLTVLSCLHKSSSSSEHSFTFRWFFGKTELPSNALCAMHGNRHFGSS